MTPAIHKNHNLLLLLSAVFVLVGAVGAWTEIYVLIVIPFGLLLFYLGWQHPGNIFFLLIFTLAFSVEYNFSPELSTDIPDEFLMILVSVLFTGYLLFQPDAIPKNVLRHPLFLLFLIYAGWTILSVCFSTHPVLSIKFLLAKSWYTGAFLLAPLILFREKKHIIKAAKVFAVSMLLVTFIVLIKHTQYNFSFAGINKAVSPFFRNHVNYSAMLVCTIPVLTAFFRLAKKANLRLLLATLIVLVLTALFFSYARSAWVALAAGLVAGWLIRRRMLLIVYLAGIILVITALFWIKTDARYVKYAHDYKTTIFHKDFNEHLVATYKLKDVSTAERFYRWIAGIRMIKDNWLTGFGPATFYTNYKPYTVPAYKTWVSDNKEHSTVHNYFLLVAVEQGLPGVFIFLLLTGAMLWYAQHLYNRVSDSFYKTVFITTGIMLVMIITLNSLSDLMETDKIGSLFFLSLSLLIITDINSRKGSNSPAYMKSIP